ncbi:MAG: hypothetical protein Q7K35_05190 [bacterium]|nr:hypothetical protein [bacterium]
MENPNFLKQKYDLHKAPEVEVAARRAGKELPLKSAEDANARIQNYLDRFKEITDRKDPNKRKRGIDALKTVLYDKFVIKPEEIPESYFDSIKRKHRAEGHGDIEIPDDYRQDLAQTLIADQQKSLANWIDYLASDEAKYPDWLKYYAMRSILKMGRYDKTKKAFTERRSITVSPFPDLNREALVIVLESLERQSQGQPPQFGYDIEAETKKEFTQSLEKKNFPRLYALAVEEFKPIPEELLKITEGKWVKYEKGSDHRPLVESISSYGTGWCLRGEAMAERYLSRDKNDLHVYYSLDEKGQPVVPRVVMVINGNNKITEVRGVAEQENLDQYIGGVVQEKLGEHPDGKAYEKKSADMKLLTEIERKSQTGEPLAKSDLVFLYEINSNIEGFGYQKDPRIEEIRKERNPKADAPIVFDCEPSQIARSVKEINENTKAYVGKLEPGIFQKLPDTLEHIYTSFPESKIQKYQVKIGGKTKDQLKAELTEKKIYVPDWINQLIDSPDFTIVERTETADLVLLAVDALGFSSEATTDEIYKRAEELGLELCSPEVGPHFRLQYSGKEGMLIAMKQISDRSGNPSIFLLYTDRGQLGLGGRDAEPGYGWYSDYKFVFRSRKSET